MEPSSKKRKLAPKVDTAAAAKAQPNHYPQENNIYNIQDHSHQERHDFESFARHLQDAAMLVKRQTELPVYSDVSVLLLRWEDDVSVEKDLSSLEKVFRSYNYHTHQWKIPTVPNPSIKLGVQMASFLENARPDHLLIVYYAGYGYVSADNQLFWACNTRKDTAKLKWDGVRCLFEDAQSDILLLLDTCSLPDLPAAGSHGMKQVIAASTKEQEAREKPEPSFTTDLVDALVKLGKGRNFSTHRLHDELCAAKRQRAAPARWHNGVPHSPSPPSMPLFLTLTPGKAQHLMLSPLHSRATLPQNGDDLPVGPAVSANHHDQLIDAETAADLRFDETKILVCTTFVGEASLEMAHFNQWLQETPENGAKITVEGMFIGPPTMLLISMSQSIWNVVQHDKVCCFLGYINSHNMLHLYQKLIGPASVKPSAKEVEEGRILLEARERADRMRGDAESHKTYQPVTPRRTAGSKPKREMEDSEEMQEAAEQLKALSHVRHLSDESIGLGLEKQRTTLPNGLPDSRLGLDPDALATQGLKDTAIGRGKAVRRSLQKQEARCLHCSHAPFKDSSSLRKHVAAAHTRPFPCAFSFAGCQSTFGSKNEWKRHIASQHLCLSFYRCSSCPASGPDGKGNEFNRKDLFTQHLRRMHAPFQIKRAIAKTDARVQQDWEKYVKDMQQSCLVTRRLPPQKAVCPKKDCQVNFEGRSAWDEWTEHVGRHMEKGTNPKLGIDQTLAKWAVDEGIIEEIEKGEYRLVGSSGNSGAGGWNSSVSSTVAPALTDASSAESTNSISATSTAVGFSSSPTELMSVLGKRAFDARDDEAAEGNTEPMSYEEIKKIVDPLMEAKKKGNELPSPTITVDGSEPAKEMEIDD